MDTDAVGALYAEIEKAASKGLMPRGGSSRMRGVANRTARQHGASAKTWLKGIQRTRFTTSRAQEQHWSSLNRAEGKRDRAKGLANYLGQRKAGKYFRGGQNRAKPRRTGGDFGRKYNVYKASDDISKAKPKTLYVYRPVENAEDILSWARGQGFKSLLPAEKLHVTIIASASEINWANLFDDHHLEPATERASMCDCGPVYRWEDRAKTKTIEGGVREVKKLGDKAVVLGFESLSLMQRFVDLRRAGATSKFSAFQAHITLTVSGDVPKDVTPYEGKIVLGEECWEEFKDGAYDNVEEVVTKAGREAAISEIVAAHVKAALEAKPASEAA